MAVRFFERELSKDANIFAELKKCAMQLIGTFEDCIPFILTSHLLDHVVKDHSLFPHFAVLDISGNDHFNFIIQTFVKMTFVSKATTIAKTEIHECEY